MKELNQSEMLAIYLMGLGQEIPDKVTKFDLIKIIHLLCKKLDWVDEDEEPMEEGNHRETVDNQKIEESKANKTNPIIVSNMPQTDGFDCQSKSVKIEGGHQKQSAASDSQQIDDIPRQEEVEKINEDKNAGSTAEENLETETNIKSKVEEISGTGNKCVENKGSTEGNITDPQNKEDEFPFSCNLCYQKFSKERFLAAHAYMKHEDTALENEVTFSCSKCDMTFSIREELSTHEMTHSENTQYHCSKCEEKFSRADMLKSHEIIHLTDQLGLGTSDTIFIDNLIKKLKNNERVYTADGSFSCTHCSKTFSSAQTLRIHERIHTGQKLYHCSKCDYNATKLQNLQIHEKIHTGEKLYSCSHCDYKCIMSSNLKIHQRIHTGEKPFKCSFCDYRCTVGSTLKLHERIHTGNKPFKCVLCDYRCTSANYLKLHMKTHPGKPPKSLLKKSKTIPGQVDKLNVLTGNNPYKSIRCTQCDKTFSKNSELWKHKKKTHKQNYSESQVGKPFSCVLCGQSFSFANSCKRHMRTHTKEKPYSCKPCGKKFTFNEELRRHSKQCKVEV